VRQQHHSPENPWANGAQDTPIARRTAPGSSAKMHASFGKRAGVGLPVHEQIFYVRNINSFCDMKKESQVGKSYIGQLVVHTAP
jgi:hypothetical protein